MEYADIQFPPRLAMGVQRRRGWSTTVVANFGGYETTNQNWSRVRHSFDAAFAVRTASDFDVIVQHFDSVRGRAKFFPLKDALDYRVEASRGVLLEFPDSPVTSYQLAKTYGAAPHTYNRIITRPKSGTLLFQRTRSAVVTNITGSATVDYATGEVSFTGGAVLPGDVLAWSGQFFVPCRYDTDELPSLIRDRHPGPNGELLVQCDGIPVVEVREGPDL